MKVYFDILSGEELFSESYNVEVVDEIMFCLKSHFMVRQKEKEMYPFLVRESVSSGSSSSSSSPSPSSFSSSSSSSGVSVGHLSSSSVSPSVSSVVSSSGVSSSDFHDLSSKEVNVNPNDVTINNFVYKYKLIKIPLNKREYINNLKQYIFKIEQRLQSLSQLEELEEFQTHAPKFIKKITSNFEKWNFYYTQNALDQGMIILQNFDEKDKMTPKFYFWKHGTVFKNY